MKRLKINYLAVVLCVILSMALGAVWYTIFADPWMSANDLSLTFIEENANMTPYVIAIIANLITVYVLAWLYVKMQVESPIRGLMVGLLLGIAFYFVVNYTQNAFSFRSSTLSFIDGGIIVISWAVTGAILGAWRSYGHLET